MQGVGFRPHVHRLATDLGLAGFVLNDAAGVLLEVEATPAAVERFLERLRRRGAAPRQHRAPACPRSSPPMGERGFAILLSDGAGEPSAAVAPDVATCADCLAELRDPADRRHRYPFINCTACGPRYTIVTGVPYDRARTTMAGFAMCDLCRAEYEDPVGPPLPRRADRLPGLRPVGPPGGPGRGRRPAVTPWPRRRRPCSAAGSWP